MFNAKSVSFESLPNCGYRARVEVAKAGSFRRRVWNVSPGEVPAWSRPEGEGDARNAPKLVGR